MYEVLSLVTLVYQASAVNMKGEVLRLVLWYPALKTAQWASMWLNFSGFIKIKARRH